MVSAIYAWIIFFMVVVFITQEHEVMATEAYTTAYSP